MVINIKPFAPYHCRFESFLRLGILSFERAIQLAYKTLMVLLRDGQVMN
jgi:hypothetical protein